MLIIQQNRTTSQPQPQSTNRTNRLVYLYICLRQRCYKLLAIFHFYRCFYDLGCLIYFPSFHSQQQQQQNRTRAKGVRVCFISLSRSRTRSLFPIVCCLHFLKAKWAKYRAERNISSGQLYTACDVRMVSRPTASTKFTYMETIYSRHCGIVFLVERFTGGTRR